jgi:N-acetylmuramoyl-L-alanine amidase
MTNAKDALDPKAGGSYLNTALGLLQQLSDGAGGGSSSPSLVNGSKEDLTGYKYIVIHETVSGVMTEKSIAANSALKKEAHFVVLQDGTVVQNGNLKDAHYGTKSDSPYYRDGKSPDIPKDRQAPYGEMIHIETDYRGQSEIIKGKTIKAVPMTDEQYRALAKLVVDIAALKGEKIAIVPHREVDRGLKNGHNDPTNFDYDKFNKYVQQELKDRGLDSSLVKVADKVIWDTPNQAGQVGNYPPKTEGPIQYEKTK